MIDKQAYIEGDLSSLFFISPLNTLVSLWAAGELFHSRTISYVTAAYMDYQKKEVKQKEQGKGFPVAGIALKEVDQSGWIVRIGDQLQKAYELFDYIARHVHIIKVPQDEGRFNPSPAVLESYYKTQQDITALFKAMITLRKYIRSKKGGAVEKPSQKPDLANVSSRLNELTQTLDRLNNVLMKGPV